MSFFIPLRDQSSMRIPLKPIALFPILRVAYCVSYCVHLSEDAKLGIKILNLTIS